MDEIEEMRARNRARLAAHTGVDPPPGEPEPRRPLLRRVVIAGVVVIVATALALIVWLR